MCLSGCCGIVAGSFDHEHEMPIAVFPDCPCGHGESLIGRHGIIERESDAGSHAGSDLVGWILDDHADGVGGAARVEGRGDLAHQAREVAIG